MIKTPRFLWFFAAAIIGSVVAATPANAAAAFVPMKIIQTVDPVFPVAALNMGIVTGDARIAIQIDETGHLTDYIIAGYSHPAFGDAAVDALKQWRFEPALLHGVAVSVTEDILFSFRSGAVVIDINVLSTGDFLYHRYFRGTDSFHVCPPSELDRVPTAIKVVKPEYVPAQARGGPAHVTVTFYIDPAGRVRLPAVTFETNAANEALSAAAVNALSQWQFEPPVSKKRPTLVMAQQDFYFRAATP
jgi:TonB family protein